MPSGSTRIWRVVTRSLAGHLLLHGRQFLSPPHEKRHSRCVREERKDSTSSNLFNQELDAFPGCCWVAQGNARLSCLHHEGIRIPRAQIFGGRADHVHILCSLSTSATVAEVIGEAKRNSSKWIKTKGGDLELFKWQNGYGVSSEIFSKITEVQEYICDQMNYRQQSLILHSFFQSVPAKGIEQKWCLFSKFPYWIR